jgi:hypothetical protein
MVLAELARGASTAALTTFFAGLRDAERRTPVLRTSIGQALEEGFLTIPNIDVAEEEQR